MTLPRLLLTGAIAAGLSAAVVAAGPTFWTQATASEALRGTSTGVAIGLDGALTLGPTVVNRLSATPAQIWALGAAPDGTLWAGIGGDGKLLQLRPGQAESTAADTAEASVFAVASAGTRTYFATSPDGRVYVVENGAAARPFFDPKEKYIWALAVDGSGRLWVGAGTPAVIYRVDASGNGQAVYHPPAAHVVALVPDGSGRMLAGTDSPGRVYRFDAADHPFVLLDTGLTEARGIAPGPNGVVYVAAVSKGDDASAGGGEATSVAASTPPPPPATGGVAPAPTGRRSVIFRIDASGAWDPFWETPDLIYDVVVDRDGTLLAASGPDGRLYRVAANQRVTLVTGIDAKQITRLVLLPNGGLAAATANPGRVVAIGPGTPTSGSYVSPVRDTKSASTWGTIRWQATQGVTLFTRAGNTDRPDESWSDWSAAYTRRDGDAIASPAGRFLQWKAVLAGSAGAAAPQLTSVTVAYLPRNARPVVSSITVHPPGVVFQKPFAADEGAIAGMDDATAEARKPAGADPSLVPPTGRRMYQKSLQTIAWKADDADGDHLTYSLYIRREGESAWRLLKADLSDTIFVWDTTTVSDGRYIARIVASDAASNAADRALSGERESDPIEVDNTPPTMTMTVVRQNGLHLVVQAHDAQSPIDRLEFSIGGGRWQLAYPVDGVADSPDERYDLPVASDADLARMVVRVTDALQNVATQAAPIR